MRHLEILKDLLGWVYFFAWSATFWPQVMLNFRRRTTVGLSHDFVAFNVIGFIAYAIFTFCGYFFPGVRADYLERTGVAPQIEIQDVLFAGHGALMTLTLLYQVLFYPPGPTPKYWVAATAVVSIAGIFVAFVLSSVGTISWVVYLETCGAIKVVTSIIKHFPQAYSNMKRKSTTGWSYTMVLLDVVGGSFSLAQQVVRCVLIGSAAPFTKNLSKTTLAAESLAFDFFFIYQHAFLYTDRRDYDAEMVQSSENAGKATDELQEDASLLT